MSFSWPSKWVKTHGQWTIGASHLTTGEQLFSRVLRFFGIGESQLVTILADIIEEQSDPTVAPYAKTGEVTLRLSTKAKDQNLSGISSDVLEKEILSRHTLDHQPLRELFYGYGDDNSMAKVAFGSLETDW